MTHKFYCKFKNNITHALFDADQTLYPASIGFEEQVLDTVLTSVARETFKKHISKDISEEYIQEKFTEYYHQYGASLVGVAKDLGLEASLLFDEAFKKKKIDYTCLPKCTKTREELIRLRDQNKIRLAILSNSTDLHVHQVIAAMGLDGLFGLIHGINHHNFSPKSDPNTFKNTLWEMAVEPEDVVLFEDSLKNLKVARDLGLGFSVYIGETEAHPPENTENLFDLWAPTLPEALAAFNNTLKKEQNKSYAS